jgi:hypothetical protein
MLGLGILWELAEHSGRRSRRNARTRARARARAARARAAPLTRPPLTAAERRWAGVAALIIGALLLAIGITANRPTTSTTTTTPDSITRTTPDPLAGTTLYAPGPDGKPIACTDANAALPTCQRTERIVHGGGRG